MAPGGPQPTFEQPPKAPEGSKELPETSGGFEVSGEARPAERAPEAVLAPAPIAPAPAPVQKDPVAVGIEGVLEEGLADTYMKMDAGARARFKAQGEKVAEEVAMMVRTFKVNAGRVLDLILGWLKLIPGVNRFFLEQEAKIKTDKILRLAEEERRKRGDV